MGLPCFFFYVNPYPVAYDPHTPEEFFEAIRNRDETSEHSTLCFDTYR